MKTPIVYWRAHFLSEQEKKRRIPTMKYDSLLYVVPSEDVKIGQHDKCEKQTKRYCGKEAFTLLRCLPFMPFTTSLSTYLIEVVLCAMLSFRLLCHSTTSIILSAGQHSLQPKDQAD